MKRQLLWIFGLGLLGLGACKHEKKDFTNKAFEGQINNIGRTSLWLEERDSVLYGKMVSPVNPQDTMFLLGRRNQAGLMTMSAFAINSDVVAATLEARFISGRLIGSYINNRNSIPFGLDLTDKLMAPPEWKQPGNQTGIYSYDLGKNRPKGHLAITQLDGNVLDIELTRIEASGRQRSIHTKSVVNGNTAYVQTGNGSGNCPLRIRFYYDFATLDFADGSHGTCGNAANFDGIYVFMGDTPALKPEDLLNF